MTDDAVIDVVVLSAVEVAQAEALARGNGLSVAQCAALLHDDHPSWMWNKPGDKEGN